MMLQKKIPSELTKTPRCKNSFQSFFQVKIPILVQLNKKLSSHNIGHFIKAINMELNDFDECIQFALNYLASQTGDERLKQKLDSK